MPGNDCSVCGTGKQTEGHGAACDRCKIQCSAMAGFLKALKRTTTPENDFAPHLWNTLAEKATVNADGNMVFAFENDVKIKQKP